MLGEGLREDEVAWEVSGGMLEMVKVVNFMLYTCCRNFKNKLLRFLRNKMDVLEMYLSACFASVRPQV